MKDSESPEINNKIKVVKIVNTDIQYFSEILEMNDEKVISDCFVFL